MLHVVCLNGSLCYECNNFIFIMPFVTQRICQRQSKVRIEFEFDKWGGYIILKFSTNIKAIRKFIKHPFWNEIWIGLFEFRLR